MPSLLCFKDLEKDIVTAVRYLPLELHLDEELVAWIEDSVFFSQPDNDDKVFARLLPDSLDDGSFRASRRLRSDMLLLASHGGRASIVSHFELYTAGTTDDHSKPSASAHRSLSMDGSESTTDDEVEAITPEMGNSLMDFGPAGKVSDSVVNDMSAFVSSMSLTEEGTEVIQA
jgi:hypothetical protein